MKSKLLSIVGLVLFFSFVVLNMEGNSSDFDIKAIAGSGQCEECYSFKLVNSTCGGKICVRRSGYTCNVHDQIPC